MSEHDESFGEVSVDGQYPMEQSVEQSVEPSRPLQPGDAADLERISQLPLSDQPAAYQALHDDLQRALAAIDEA